MVYPRDEMRVTCDVLNATRLMLSPLPYSPYKHLSGMTTVDSFGRSSVSTPARATAISSSFANRASPSVQPASKAYEPHLRAVLSKKFVSNVLGGAGIASWFISVTWITWQQSTPGSIGLFRWVVNSLSPLSVFYAFLLWMVAAVPIAVVRKYYLNSKSSMSKNIMSVH